MPDISCSKTKKFILVLREYFHVELRVFQMGNGNLRSDLFL